MHGAPKLDGYVPHVPKAQPRNVTANASEIDTLMRAASPSIRAMLVFCSDLAIRSGTAVRIGPHDYDPENGNLFFQTKMGERVKLPVTLAVRRIIESCDLRNPLPFVTQIRVAQTKNNGRPMANDVVDVSQLRSELADLRDSLGLKRIVFHDLRRTSAVNLLHYTKDLRLVQAYLGHGSLQSTFHYLASEIDPIAVEDLEAIKKPFIVYRKEKSA
jgi:integrase